VIIKIIKIYQFIVSPFLGKNCRFSPTCSQYAIDSIKQNGIFYGTILSLIRILKCNPFFKGGVDEAKPMKKYAKIITSSITILFLLCFLAYAEDQPKQQPKKSIDITNLDEKNLSKKNQQKLEIIKKIEHIRKKYIFNKNLDIKDEIYHKIQNINTRRKPYNKFARKKIPYSLITDNRSKKNRHIALLLKKKHLLSGIFNAIYEDDSQIFLAFLKKLNDSNAINVATGETMLTESIKLKRRKIIYHLASYGADLDKENLKRETPLHIAIKMKDAAIVTALLEFGAKKDIVDNNKETYLMKAIKENHIPTIKAILEAGVVNADKVNNNKLTAIDMAYIGKKEIVVKLLENYGLFLHRY
jgi:putative membrane protein insertion efficiency factor